MRKTSGFAQITRKCANPQLTYSVLFSKDAQKFAKNSCAKNMFISWKQRKFVFTNH